MQKKFIRVLMIEDDPTDVRLIQEMLFEDGDGRFNLKVVDVLTAGINALGENQYDVILLDLTLPDSSGLATLLELQAHAPEIPIVVLTGGLDEVTRFGVKAVQGGAQDYLIKSDIDSIRLIRAIHYAIERHDIEARLRRSEEEYRSLIDDVFETSMVAVIILDREFRIVWCNEATEIYFSVERECILGRDKRQFIDDELKCVFADPDDYATHMLKAYEAGSFTDRFECRVLPDDNREERWLEHWSQPIRDGMYNGGRIEQYMDITVRKNLEIAEREQREFAEALHNIATTLTSTLNIDEVFGHILSSLSAIVPHDSASITILDDEDLWVARQRHGKKRDTQEIIAERQFQVDYRIYFDQMINSGKPLLISDISASEQGWEKAQKANIHAYLGTPILLQDKTMGFINLLNEATNSFREADMERLTAFAGLAAIAIQNARSYGESRQLAMLEERQRLARDLHDSVSQTIFTCRTMLESALKRFDRDPERSLELVSEVHKLVIIALREMRILLLELRPESLTQVSLKQLFEQYLQPIQDRHQFDLELTIEDIPKLPGDVQMELYRITQEVLNNISKHAQASTVVVYVFQDENSVVIEICDDGKGFELEAAKATSMGLKIMRERATAINAQLEIESSPGKGTCIKVRWNWRKNNDRR